MAAVCPSTHSTPPQAAPVCWISRCYGKDRERKRERERERERERQRETKRDKEKKIETQRENWVERGREKEREREREKMTHLHKQQALNHHQVYKALLGFSSNYPSIRALSS